MNKMIGMVLGLGFALSSQASVIALYDFTDSSLAAETAEGVTAGSYGVGAGLSSVITVTNADPAKENTYDGFTFGGAKSSLGFAASKTVLADAITANDYMTFTVTPDGENSSELTSLTFWLKMNSGNTACDQYAIFSGNAGFTAVAGEQILAGKETIESTYSQQTIDLSTLADITSATEFRIYIYGANGGASSSFSGYDEVTLSGSVVPEPATLGMLGLGALLTLWIRRQTRG